MPYGLGTLAQTPTCMEIQTEETGLANGRLSGDVRMEDTLWQAAGTLYQRRRFIAGVVLIACVLSIIVALLLPRYYMSEARLLEPEGDGLSMLSGIGAVGGGLGNLLGTGGSEFNRYLSILTSRSVKESVVEEFDLIRQYGLEEEEAPLESALAELDENIEFAVDDIYLFLAVRAYDPDPVQAAAMANFMVDELNATHARLSSATARQTRLAVERRLQRAELDLDSIRTAIQTFQEENGVVELEAQAEAFLQSVAASKAELAQAEVQYQALLQQYGPDNPQVRAALEVLRAGRLQVQGALGGRDALLPVSMQDLPAVTRRYAELMQGQLTQAQIIEALYPLYEQAFFQEQNESVAVQVVDEAVPSSQPARPSRRAIVVLVAISSLLLATAYVLLLAWWQRNYHVFARRLQSAQAAVDS